MIRNSRPWCAVVVFLFAGHFAMTPPPSAAGEWKVISAEVTQKLADAGEQKGFLDKSGGIAVDAKTGDVFMVMCDAGLWKSSDQGETFTRVDDGKVHGRCETNFSLNPDPAGGRLMCFMIYGGSALTTDGGKTFSESKTSHLDYGAVDWEATGKTMLADRHESGHMLTLSRDAGATWTDLGKGFDGCLVGVFDGDTLIASKGEGILRSTNGGGEWKKVSDAKTVSAVVKVRDGVGYVLSDEGLLVTKDKGATWMRQGSPVQAMAGPYFGKIASHLLVVGNDGVLETTDGGETWKNIAALPPDYPRIAQLGRGAQPSFAFDPARNILYASFMGKPAYKMQR